ncbi:hypothetical protein D5S18_25825 [Nocardia panacis]|uniref:Fe2OG dioxygenase domain-containing protein n=1 Tax=Nocardia panacis TaxID=2340916 RepID=A0A3A4KB36_9NOCA|nr:hypothetical protein [Nocardia panacis]RJO70640.1 hypothetical protein D5S18_25825 [Nocardia panacis]
MIDVSGPHPPHPRYRSVAPEIVFDPATDLDLRRPAAHTTMAQLGYSPRIQARFPADIAVTAPFRMFSPRGVEKLQHVVRTLKSTVLNGDSGASTAVKPAATGAMVRGTVHRNAYIRDLIGSPCLHEFIQSVLGVAVLPTYLSHELGHLNIPPADPVLPAVKWHCDTNSIVLVVNVFDTADLDGGDFQFFDGPRNLGRAFLDAGEEVPESRIVTPGLVRAGWAVLLQGAAVLHRASSLRTPGERVTMASAFDPVDATFPDPNRFYPLVREDAGAVSAEIESQFFELARHRARRSAYLLERYLQEATWTPNPEVIAADLDRCVAEVNETLHILRQGGISAAEAAAKRKEDDEQLFSDR